MNMRSDEFGSIKRRIGRHLQETENNTLGWTDAAIVWRAPENILLPLSLQLLAFISLSIRRTSQRYFFSFSALKMDVKTQLKKEKRKWKRQLMGRRCREGIGP
ncbi:hypothetical protein AVEN_272-1 [Araneus ventricosus]|uniref:Uncharacterized protein n=1 Tax=Araneus ventricosus TaxID=182803 RepID=A0A4Y2CPG3_ARAVE|nr:hypothetical protein AVEN_272-1 [Araneus ventricosus]